MKKVVIRRGNMYCYHGENLIAVLKADLIQETLEHILPTVITVEDPAGNELAKYRLETYRNDDGAIATPFP